MNARQFTIPIAVACLALGCCHPSSQASNEHETEITPSQESFADLVKAAKTRLDSLPDYPLAQAMAVRVDYDQRLRRAISEHGSNPNAGEWTDLQSIDRDNREYLERVLPSEGWLRLSQHDQKTVRGAFLIVQHSGDVELMERVISAMEAFPEDEVVLADYALLKDRILLFRGENQIYGSQLTCVAGKFGFHPIQDPWNVNERRADVGLEPIEAYEDRFPRIGRAC